MPSLDALPAELLLEVAGYLPHINRYSLMLVSKQQHAVLSKSAAVWRDLDFDAISNPNRSVHHPQLPVVLFSLNKAKSNIKQFHITSCSQSQRTLSRIVRKLLSSSYDTLEKLELSSIPSGLPVAALACLRHFQRLTVLHMTVSPETFGSMGCVFPATLRDLTIEMVEPESHWQTRQFKLAHPTGDVNRLCILDKRRTIAFNLAHHIAPRATELRFRNSNVNITSLQTQGPLSSSLEVLHIVDCAIIALTPLPRGITTLFVTGWELDDAIERNPFRRSSLNHLANLYVTTSIAKHCNLEVRLTKTIRAIRNRSSLQSPVNTKGVDFKPSGTVIWRPWVNTPNDRPGGLLEMMTDIRPLNIASLVLGGRLANTTLQELAKKCPNVRALYLDMVPRVILGALIMAMDSYWRHLEYLELCVAVPTFVGITDGLYRFSMSPHSDDIAPLKLLRELCQQRGVKLSCRDCAYSARGQDAGQTAQIGIWTEAADVGEFLSEWNWPTHEMDIDAEEHQGLDLRSMRQRNE